MKENRIFKYISYFFKYIFTIFIMFIFGLLVLDNLIMPIIVDSNDLLYLPDLRNKYLEKANIELEDLYLTSEVKYKSFNENYVPGTVIQMHPSPFTKIRKGRKITLTVAGSREDIIIPSFENFSIRNARIKIQELGLKIDTIINEFHYEIPNNKITFQRPRDGHIVKTGTRIILGVSKGPPPNYYTVPDLINLSFKQAKNSLYSSGLRLGEVRYELHPKLLINTVVDQSLPGGMPVTYPVEIDLTISIDRGKEINEK